MLLSSLYGNEGKQQSRHPVTVEIVGAAPIFVASQLRVICETPTPTPRYEPAKHSVLGDESVGFEVLP